MTICGKQGSGDIEGVGFGWSGGEGDRHGDKSITPDRPPRSRPTLIPNAVAAVAFHRRLPVRRVRRVRDRVRRVRRRARHDHRQARPASAGSLLRTWSAHRGRACHRHRRQTSWHARQTARARVVRRAHHLPAPCGPHGSQDRFVPRGVRPARGLRGRHPVVQMSHLAREAHLAARAAGRQRPSPARRRSPPWPSRLRFPAYVSSQTPWTEAGSSHTDLSHHLQRRLPPRVAVGSPWAVILPVDRSNPTRAGVTPDTRSTRY